MAQKRDNIFRLAQVKEILFLKMAEFIEDGQTQLRDVQAFIEMCTSLDEVLDLEFTSAASQATAILRVTRALRL
jgi:hypothetical protein